VGRTTELWDVPTGELLRCLEVGKPVSCVDYLAGEGEFSVYPPLCCADDLYLVLQRYSWWGSTMSGACPLHLSVFLC
jgi:hypothetical protein